MMLLHLSLFGILFSAAFSAELSGFVDMTGSRPGTEGSKLFYWFTPAQTDSDQAPLLIWLQGGPGSPGELGLFFEIGPYYLNENLEMESRTVGNWNQEYNVLFLDQPIGTGYSYAGTDAAYVTNQDDVATDLYFFLQKWYIMYESYAKSPLFLTGESYGGHYIPSFAYRILNENDNISMTGNRYVNLQGVAIGDGLTDPCSQVEMGPRAAYDFGIVDMKTYAKASEAALRAGKACREGNFTAAHDYRSQMEDTVITASGINKYDVTTFGTYDYMHERMDAFLNTPEAKTMLNVPQEVHFGTDDLVSERLYDDVMQSQADKIPFLLKRIRVLLYQGQFDWKDGAFSNELWINRMEWEGKEAYLSAPRLKWLTPLNGEEVLSGWVQTYSSLTELVVNSAGHLAPMNQPERLFDMITTFVQNKPFKTAN